MEESRIRIRKLSEEWTDQQIAKMTEDEKFEMKKEIMLRLRSAINVTPKVGRMAFRMEVRKKFHCPYER